MYIYIYIYIIEDWCMMEIRIWTCIDRSYIYTYICVALFSCSTACKFNSLKPSDAYMRQQTRSSLVQIRDCRLIGATLLSELVLDYYYLDSWEQISVYLNQSTTIFIQENEFENVDSKMAAICLGPYILNRHQTILHTFLNFSSIAHYQACHIFYKQIPKWTILSDLCKMCNLETNPWKMWTGDHRFLTYIFKWEG